MGCVVVAGAVAAVASAVTHTCGYYGTALALHRGGSMGGLPIDQVEMQLW